MRELVKPQQFSPHSLLYLSLVVRKRVCGVSHQVQHTYAESWFSHDAVHFTLHYHVCLDTVKPVSRDHSWEAVKVVSKGRWSLRKRNDFFLDFLHINYISVKHVRFFPGSVFNSEAFQATQNLTPLHSVYQTPSIYPALQGHCKSKTMEHLPGYLPY